MICASYTRSAARAEAALPIEEQEKAINVFAEDKGLSIQQAFSDSEPDLNADKEYFKMKDAGLARKYDCIVVYSLFYFGRDFSVGYNLLRHSFIPAGIAFAVAQDRFLSTEHTQSEIDEYLKTCYKRKKGLVAKHRVEAHIDPRANSLYGYTRERNTDEFFIDEKVAPIVRNIFAMFLEKKKTATEITDYLNDNGIRSSHYYLADEAGRDTADIPIKWNREQVKKILTDSRYCGIRNRHMSGKTYTQSCPAYITIEQHETALGLFGKGRKSPDVKFDNPLVKCVHDKDSGFRLCASAYMGKGNKNKYYHFNKLPPTIDAYERRTILMDYVHERVLYELKKEIWEAKALAKFMQTKEGLMRCEDLLKPYREPMQKAFDAMLSEIDKCFTYEEQSSGRLPELNEAFEKARAAFERKRLALSMNNPWVKLFSNGETIKELDKEIAKKYIDKVYVERFKSVELIPRLLEWKTEIPKEWLEACYGT